MNNYALGNLHINLTYYNNNIYVKPIFLNPDNLQNIYDVTAPNNFYLVLEYESTGYSDIFYHYRKSYTKYKTFKKIYNFTFNTTYTISKNEILNDSNVQHKTGDRFRLRATYKYRDPYKTLYKGINNQKTHIYSNEIIIEK